MRIEDRSLHIEFDPELEQDRINLLQFRVETLNEKHNKIKDFSDFCQMASIDPLKKEIGIETSNKVMTSIIEI